MNILIIVNESPYATERAFNALRLALAVQKQGGMNRVRVFLLSDGVTCALPNQLRPAGSYNVEQMLCDTLAAGVEVKVCITCAEHRGLVGIKLVEGVAIGSMPELAEWVGHADRVISF